jgi:Mg2+ and Co2+ transporter CorA
MDGIKEEDRLSSQKLLNRECENLILEIDRLTAELQTQERRLKNVMALVFSSVNIIDSKYMRQMTEAAVRDSAAMKQIAYLTMVFLPATFAAGIFGMNVNEITPLTNGSLWQYLALAIPLTLLTAWLIVAFQSKYVFPKGTSFMKRLAWPVYLVLIPMFSKSTAEVPGYFSTKTDFN